MLRHLDGVEALQNTPGLWMMPPMFWTRNKTLLAITVLAMLTLVPLMPVSVTAGLLLLAYLPGRIALRFLDAEHHWSMAGRVVLSVSVSLATVPFFLNPIWHVTNNGLHLLGFTWLVLVLLTLVRGNPRSGTFEASENAAGGDADDGTDGLSLSGQSASIGQPAFFEHAVSWKVAGFLVAFMSCAIVLMYWPTELFGYPVAAHNHDFIKHFALLDSMQHRPLPFGNPFYAVGSDKPVYYYHFFYLIPATVRAWAGYGISIEMVFAIAGTLVALSTCGLTYAITKRLSGGETCAWLAVALITVVGGFDFIVFVPQMYRMSRPLVVLDAWTWHPYVIHDLLFQMTWSPQNISGLMTMLVGVYFLSYKPHWRGWFILGPILGATILGASVWVALGALPALGVWAVLRRKHLVATIGIGVLMAIVSLPTLVQYMDSGGRSERGLTIQWPEVAPHEVLGKLVGPGIIANFLDLPMQFIVDFGAKALFLPLVAAAFWKKAWRDPGLKFLFVAAVLALLANRIVRSELRHNDFGQKIVMITTVFTAIMAGCAVARQPGRRCWWNPLGWTSACADTHPKSSLFIALCLFAGLPRGFYEAPVGAVRRYASEFLELKLKNHPTISREDMDGDEEARTFMRYQLPEDAVIQPDIAFNRAYLGQVTRKQLGVMDPEDDVGVFMPSEPEAYLQAVDDMANALWFDPDAGRTHATLKRYKVTHVFLGWRELLAWKHLEKYDDDRYFEDVFRRGRIRVMKVK